MRRKQINQCDGRACADTIQPLFHDIRGTMQNRVSKENDLSNARDNQQGQGDCADAQPDYRAFATV
jgi:hypothetical protein